MTSISAGGRGTVHRDFRPATKALVGALVVVSNVVGAAIVLALAGYVLPTQSLVADLEDALDRNLWTFGLYLAVAVVVGLAWGYAWVRVPRPPTAGDDEDAWRRHRHLARRAVLNAPLRITVVQAVPWVLAVLLFVTINAGFSLTVALTVGCVVALGGIATVAVAYRLSELTLRDEVARVLAEDPPNRLGLLPGVVARSLGAWVLGTGVPLLGIALAAAASLLFRDYYTVTRLGIVVLVLAVVALAVGFLLTALTSTSMSRPVMAVRRALRRVQDGDLDARVEVSDPTELGMLQAGFNEMAAGLRERDRVRELFGRHVGQEVARAALAEEIELGGEVREVAVLFVDIVGSTEMAFDRPPQEVVAVLNAFFAHVVDVVETHQGWINKFEGDAALAVFGAPDDQPDPAAAALAAGRVLAERLAADDSPATAGIGVSAGPAVAGNIGDARRYEYTVIGDPVNEAARLCDLAKGLPGRVAASDAATSRAGADEAGRWCEVDVVRLRGRQRVTHVHAPGHHTED
ncbi:adenylate/guanylate cyclase domain-containing protein [Actinomycetospora lemnae]|uniref:Adenylate/guanylate cyclase domain-containing protein n=1 Tax=Actinomycetospora lemnae TaxID=3019891 RepID=A0ABT5SQA5_9PSEU|nr:adenylate/guanylate cyclase domain-containing protein [Actinomycetospora sp. DW7H6]MDD7963963.1 adenylate/guanylate cyclase domain-containing protein [Actinomycetospora sp. DW7H6]